MAPPTTTTPKTMSSRLLTMKFMQRAAASNSPASSSPSDSSAPNDSNKRRKVSHNNAEKQNVDILVNQVAVRAAIAEEERKAENAKLKRAEELGDAHWVLDVSQQSQAHASVQAPMRVVHVGYGQIDTMDDEESDSDSSPAGRYHAPAIRRYNMDNKKKADDGDKTKKKSNSSNSASDFNMDASSSSPSDSDDSDDSDSDSEESGRISFGSSSDPSATTPSATRKSLKRKKSTEQLKAMQFAEKRRKKEIKLNNPKGGISSISAGRGIPSRPSANLTCYRCSRPGHKAQDCKGSGSRQTR